MQAPEEAPHCRSYAKQLRQHFCLWVCQPLSLVSAIWCIPSGKCQECRATTKSHSPKSGRHLWSSCPPRCAGECHTLSAVWNWIA